MLFPWVCDETSCVMGRLGDVGSARVRDVQQAADRLPVREFMISICIVVIDLALLLFQGWRLDGIAVVHAILRQDALNVALLCYRDAVVFGSLDVPSK